MSAPFKPWENSVNSRHLQSSANMQNVLNTPVGRLRVTPPIPPRPNSTGTGVGYNSGNSYGIYNSGYGYNPYSNCGPYMSGYGGYGSYGSYGGYNRPLGGYGYNGPESSFIQLAEASVHPAFENIESVVRAFSSISMMMDSTFFAITNSFRAVLGIAENMGRLRTMFSQIWSSFALFRLFNWLYRKILVTLGIRKASSFGQQAWQQAVEGTVSETVPTSASWPVFMFLGIIISAPYLISKMIPSINGDRRDPSKWPSPGIPIKVLHEFKASGPQELSIIPGEIIKLAPRIIQDEMNLTNTGWIYAASNRGAGMVPKNYLQPPMKKIVNNPPVSTFEPEPIAENRMDQPIETTKELSAEISTEPITEDSIQKQEL